jgi:gamma-glutamyl-gamma-aminobutyrate hydrolase PuuD
MGLKMKILRESYSLEARHHQVLPLPWRVNTFMLETQDQWYNRQAIEQLAQHIPFERDSASKAEQIEMLRGLVLRNGHDMNPDLFGFEARNELIRLGLWKRIGRAQ